MARLIVVFFLISTLSALVGFLVFSKARKTSNNKSLTQITAVPADFPKRNFDSQKDFFYSQQYPPEVLDVPDQNLVGINCIPQYVYQVDGFYTSSTNPEIKASDQKLLEIIDIVNRATSNKVNALIYCETEDQETIVEYELWAGGGGMKTVVYFGSVDQGGRLAEIVRIPNPEIPYFECSSPLQLAKMGLLYWECGGGDAGFGASSIYRIDLNRNKTEIVIKCTSSGWPAEKVTVNCD